MIFGDFSLEPPGHLLFFPHIFFFARLLTDKPLRPISQKESQVLTPLFFGQGSQMVMGLLSFFFQATRSSVKFSFFGFWPLFSFAFMRDFVLSYLLFPNEREAGSRA